MKVLVTGGAGFLGSHLAEALLDREHSVWVVDNLSTGTYQNVRHLTGRKGFSLSVGTIFDKNLLENLIRGVDFIFHLASAVGVRTIMDHPVQSIETIIRGTSIILFLAKRYNVPVLITSTSEVYGKGSKVPFSEEDDIVLGATTKRRWAYGASKAIDEFLGFAYFQEAKLPVTCARLFNVAGPRQVENYGMVLPTFIKQALSGRDITVHGDGNQTRCFCHVDDVVQALVSLSACPEAIGRTVNIGSQEEISIETLAQKVKAITKSPSKIVYLPYEKVFVDGFEDMVRRVPDLSLAKKLINFSPTHELDEILMDTIAWKKSR